MRAAPPGHRAIERGARRHEPPAQEGECRLVRIHVADAGAALNRHVADRHAFVDRHRVERRAAVLVGIADPTLDAEPPDDRQDDVLGIDAGAERAVDVDPPDLHPIERQALRGEDVPHLRGADAERNRSERAVRRRVAVAARDGHAGLREPELGADDVDDALVLASFPGCPELDAELLAVPFERDRHVLGHHVQERPRLRAGRHDVIDGRERTFGMGDAPALLPQHVERLRARDFVNQMQADEQLRLSARQRTHRVLVPDLVKKRVHGAPDRIPLNMSRTRLQFMLASAVLAFALVAPGHGQSPIPPGSSPGHLVWCRRSRMLPGEVPPPSKGPRVRAERVDRNTAYADRTGPSGATYMPGRVIVKFRDGMSTSARLSALSSVSPTASLTTRQPYANFDPSRSIRPRIRRPRREALPAGPTSSTRRQRIASARTSFPTIRTTGCSGTCGPSTWSGPGTSSLVPPRRSSSRCSTPALRIGTRRELQRAGFRVVFSNGTSITYPALGPIDVPFAAAPDLEGPLTASSRRVISSGKTTCRSTWWATAPT